MLESLFFESNVANLMEKVVGEKVSTTMVKTLYESLKSSNININDLLVIDSVKLSDNLNKLSSMLTIQTGIEKKYTLAFLLVLSDMYKTGKISRDIFYGENKNIITSVTTSIGTEVKKYITLIIILLSIILLISILTRRK